MAVLILLLVSTIVATGIPAARNAYEKVVVAANAQSVLSTVLSALRNELGTAREVDCKSKSGPIVYRSAKTGMSTRIFNGSDTIMVEEFAKPGEENTDYQHSLVPAAVYAGDITGKLVISYSDVSYDKAAGIITLSVSVKHKAKDKTIELASKKAYRIETFSEKVAE